MHISLVPRPNVGKYIFTQTLRALLWVLFSHCLVCLCTRAYDTGSHRGQSVMFSGIVCWISSAPILATPAPPRFLPQGSLYFAYSISATLFPPLLLISTPTTPPCTPRFCWSILLFLASGASCSPSRFPSHAPGSQSLTNTPLLFPFALRKFPPHFLKLLNQI